MFKEITRPARVSGYCYYSNNHQTTIRYALHAPLNGVRQQCKQVFVTKGGQLIANHYKSITMGG